MMVKSIGGLMAATALTLVLAACGGSAPPASSSSSSVAAASSAEVSVMAPAASAASDMSASSAADPSSSSSSALASPVGDQTAPPEDGKQFDQLKLMAPMAIPDKVMGNPDAPVTLIEYLSPTCPHCALVANTVIGPFKDKYVKTGKVKFIPRPFARNTLDAAIFILAEAAARSADGIPMSTDVSAASAPTDASAASDASDTAGAAPAPAAPTHYSEAAAEAWENVIDTYFRTQTTWEGSDKQLLAVEQVALQLGFTDASFKAAIKDVTTFNNINTMVNQAVNDFGVTGTPTFYLNGKQMMGERTLDQLSAAIDPLLK
jgi:protein-disulfide isomerase